MTKESSFHDKESPSSSECCARSMLLCPGGSHSSTGRTLMTRHFGNRAHTLKRFPSKGNGNTLNKKKEKKSVTDECSSSMANYFKLYNSPWHFLRAQRHSLGEWREKENPKHSAKRSKRRQMSMKLTTGPLNRAQAKLPTYPLPTRALTSYPQAGPGETGRRATLAEGRVSCSRPPSAVEKCGGPHSCRLHVVSLQEISVLDGKLELLRLGGEDTGVKLGRGGRRGGRGF